MPMTPTHALVPLAAALAFSNTPVAWRLLIAAAVAAALPDADWLVHHFIRPVNSLYSHRGISHSLFAALAVGLIAAGGHKWLKVNALTAGVVIAASMASHGMLDMLADSGRPVAYLWPLSSERLFADWRPIHSGPVKMAHLVPQVLARMGSDLWQVIIPLFVIALAVRVGRALGKSTQRRTRS